MNAVKITKNVYSSFHEENTSESLKIKEDLGQVI